MNPDLEEICREAAAGIAGAKAFSGGGIMFQRRGFEARVDFVGLRMRNQFDFASVRKLRALIRERNPHVIHVHKGVAHALALAATWTHPRPAFIVNRGVSFPLDIWNRGKFRSRRVDRPVHESLPKERMQVFRRG